MGDAYGVTVVLGLGDESVPFEVHFDVVLPQLLQGKLELYWGGQLDQLMVLVERQRVLYWLLAANIVHDLQAGSYVEVLLGVREDRPEYYRTTEVIYRLAYWEHSPNSVRVQVQLLDCFELQLWMDNTHVDDNVLLFDITVVELDVVIYLAVVLDYVL